MERCIQPDGQTALGTANVARGAHLFVRSGPFVPTLPIPVLSIINASRNRANRRVGRTLLPNQQAGLCVKIQFNDCSCSTGPLDDSDLVDHQLL